jgi:hypothetical protein
VAGCRGSDGIPQEISTQHDEGEEDNEADEEEEEDKEDEQGEKGEIEEEAQDPEKQRQQFRVSATARARSGQVCQAQRVNSARAADGDKELLQVFDFCTIADCSKSSTCSCRRAKVMCSTKCHNCKGGNIYCQLC